MSELGISKLINLVLYRCQLILFTFSFFLVFQKHCPKGILTVGKFKNLYASFFPDGDSDSFAECVYRSMDKNLDGKVDFQEFTHMLSVSKKGTPEERMRLAFTLYDVDKNG